MATISSAGVGSGLDVNGIVTQLLAIDRRPLTALDSQEAAYQAKLSAFGTLKSAASSLRNAATALKSTTLYSSLTAKSSDTAVLTASANTAATTGSYAIEVVKKAQAQSISSQAFASLTSDISSIDGKIKIELGTFDSGTPSFTPDPAKTAVTIDITATGSSLQEVRDAINAANAGVKANIVYVGTAGYKLTLTANDTGAKSAIKLTVTDALGVVQTNDTDLAKLSFDPTLTLHNGNEFDINVTAQDAHVKIDGLSVFRTTNTISDALTGVTLSLAGLGTSTLTVSKDSASVVSAFTTFVAAYNDLTKQLRSLTAYNQTTGESSVLTGDSGARSLENDLRRLITASRRTTAGLSSLSDLGVSLQRDGSLVFNSAKLESALSSSPSSVSELLTTSGTSNDGLAVRADKALESLVSNSGLFASRTEGISRSIADVGKQREQINRRLVNIEARYRQQYSALDSLVSSFQRTSQYLQQQLANLPTISASK